MYNQTLIYTDLSYSFTHTKVVQKRKKLLIKIEKVFLIFIIFINFIKFSKFTKFIVIYLPIIN